MIRRLFHVLPGEGRCALALFGAGAVWATATALGENVSQSVFAARVGAIALAPMFLVKGAFDVAASALYVPLTRGRSPRRVLELSLAIYAVTIGLGRLLLAIDGTWPAWALVVGHECAGTILTIHWGVYVLDAFEADAARRLFPVVFIAARAGGVVAGAMLQHLAVPVGAANLLWGSATLALIAAALPEGRPRGRPSPVDTRDGRGDEDRLAVAASLAPTGTTPTDGRRSSGDDAAVPTPTAARFPRDHGLPLARSFRDAWASPLLRAIAVSTAAMVLLRYGLRIVGLDAVERHFSGDEARVAAFLGRYSAWANAVAMGLGLLLTPRLLSTFGLGAANVAYAVCVALGYALLIVRPSLGAAVVARFVDSELKDALKTPVSALFYGAEPPERRAAARAFVFGVVIPAATIATSLAFQAATARFGVDAIVAMGAPVALFFVAASVVQNRAYRRRLAERLVQGLERATVLAVPPLPAELVVHASDPHVALAWRGLSADDPRVRELAAEVLAERVPRKLARRVAGRPRIS